MVGWMNGWFRGLVAGWLGEWLAGTDWVETDTGYKGGRSQEGWIGRFADWVRGMPKGG